MNFIVQTVNNEITLDMSFAMRAAKEFWDWRNIKDSFGIWYDDIDKIPTFPLGNGFNYEDGFHPENWCPVGTVEFVDSYLRTYFGDEVADRAMKPMNVPERFLDNFMTTGRHIENVQLIPTNYGFDISSPHFGLDDTKFMIKDNLKIKNPNNGIHSVHECFDLGLRDIQVSTLIKDEHNSSEWRAFVHNGKVIDIKNYSGSPFVFPNIDDVINSYMYMLDGTLKEGTIDVYVDECDNETYVMECHKFFSCGLYGFDHPDILPLMYWRTYKEMIG